MAIGAFPAAKLGVLAIKQISKPIANVIKSNAKQSPIFRKYICMPPAQLYNWVEVKTKMWAMNLGKPVAVPPLNEAMAIELGANLLGESIIFIIGAAVLIFEYTRQSNNEAKKQETLRQEKAELALTLAEMGFRLERQDAQIREMTRALADLGKPISIPLLNNTTDNKASSANTTSAVASTLGTSAPKQTAQTVMKQA
ncbi:putative OPA3-like protein CG13603 isoform X2 [Ceratitis capitata]|uniref:putative OPA3-like protein CG13603 isoform X2 n=1 Tax=Ceratitis capitata TaxID=7213 RepID=UPI00032A2C0B|nr:putative OPA3-like protein CG13603 isoform X2 [Ceratitis capitata]